MIKIATCQYNLTAFSWLEFKKKISKQLKFAKQKGANFFILPEYLGIEILARQSLTDTQLFSNLQLYVEKYIEFFQQQAIFYQIYILAGTQLVKSQEGPKYFNRAYFFAPNGHFSFQDKLQLTAYEKQSQLLISGPVQRIFNTEFGKIGIAICYDSEFPQLIQQIAQSGATIIFVPSYTTTFAGYYRVHLSCRARAIENQCYLVTSCIVGKIPSGTAICEVTYGLAGIYCPADIGFPENGIIIQGKLNYPDIIFGEVNLEKIEVVRLRGEVQNFTDTAFLPSPTKLEHVTL